MKRQLTLVLFSFCFLGGCSAETIEETGHYKLDVDAFAPMLAEQLIESGRAPESARLVITSQLRSTKFDLELREDGRFTAGRHVLTNKRQYSGTWKLSGTTFRLDQTHENGLPAADFMTGTLVDGTLQLEHKRDDGTLHMVLRHESLAATPPR
jgi:hypothetical protein